MEWGLWLEERLLAAVPHRQVVVTVPNRLRAYFLYGRRRLGLLSRVVCQTVREYPRAAVGEPEAVPGVIACVQSFGSLAHWHPRLHVIVTDGAFRRDGSFVSATAHDPEILTEALRWAVLERFVRTGWMEEDKAAAMRSWPRSGFGAHVGGRIKPGDRESVLRVARYAARVPVAESRLRYDAVRAEVELVSDASEGPDAGVHRLAAIGRSFAHLTAARIDERPAPAGARPAAGAGPALGSRNAPRSVSRPPVGSGSRASRLLSLRLQEPAERHGACPSEAANRKGAAS